MDLPSLAQNSITWIATGLTSILAWGVKRHLDNDEKRHDDASDRLSKVEQSLATRDDVAEVVAQVRHIEQKSTERHEELLKLLIKKSNE